MLWKRFVIARHERGLVTKNGRFGGIFLPGEYAMFLPPDVSLEVERHDVRRIVFRSVWADYLLTARGALSKRHFYCVETSDSQVAMVYINGKLFQVLTPAKRMLFWRDAAEVTAELVEVVGDAPSRGGVPRRKSKNTWTVDEETQNCLLFLHSRLARAHAPGKRGYGITRHEMEHLSDTASQLAAMYGSRMAGCLLRAGIGLRQKLQLEEGVGLSCIDRTSTEQGLSKSAISSGGDP